MVVDLLANFQLSACGFVAREQRLLSGFRVRQFLFEPANVGIEFFQSFVERNPRGLQGVDRFADPILLRQRGLRQIVAALVDRKLRLGPPVFRLKLQRL